MTSMLTTPPDHKTASFIKQEQHESLHAHHQQQLQNQQLHNPHQPHQAQHDPYPASIPFESLPYASFNPMAPYTNHTIPTTTMQSDFNSYPAYTAAAAAASVAFSSPFLDYVKSEPSGERHSQHAAHVLHDSPAQQTLDLRVRNEHPAQHNQQQQQPTIGSQPTAAIDFVVTTVDSAPSAGRPTGGFSRDSASPASSVTSQTFLDAYRGFSPANTTNGTLATHMVPKSSPMALATSPFCGSAAAAAATRYHHCTSPAYSNGSAMGAYSPAHPHAVYPMPQSLLDKVLSRKER